MSRANRLLCFKQTRLATVPVKEPLPEVLLAWLSDSDHERGIPVVPNQPEPRATQPALLPGVGHAAVDRQRGDGQVILSSYPADQLASALYNLRQKSRTAIEERGVNILHVALGFLCWDDPQAKDGNSGQWRAPVLLLPISIEKTANSDAAPYRVVALEDDTILNPTLAYKLQQEHGIQLQKPDDRQPDCRGRGRWEEGSFRLGEAGGPTGGETAAGSMRIGRRLPGAAWLPGRQKKRPE
jgi:hypothetical protein